MLTLEDYRNALREMLAHALDYELGRKRKPISDHLKRVIKEDAAIQIQEKV